MFLSKYVCTYHELCFTFLWKQVSTTSRLAHWIVRLEDVDTDGNVWLVTVGALNGAHWQTPSVYMEPNCLYTINLRLRFTTWTYLSGHRIRIAISNAMFPTYWPSPFPMNTSLFLRSSATFIDLPVLPRQSSTPSPPPAFTQQQASPSDNIRESFSRGKPRIYRKHETNRSTTVVFERITYELLPNGWFTGTLLTWNFTCSHDDPADVKWIARARQIFVSGLDGYAAIGNVPIKTTDDGLYPDIDLEGRRHFELNTDLTLHSDQDYFYMNFQRSMIKEHGEPSGNPLPFHFSSKHERQFQ
jgi:X-Pro dipeptidyl-peptidase C-terminal non-catalytic domain